MIISIGAKKDLQNSTLIHDFLKSFKKVGLEGSYLNRIKAFIKKLTTNITPSDQRWKIIAKVK